MAELHARGPVPGPAGPPRFREAPGVYLLTALLLGAAMVALLWVPSYAHVTPSLGGVPFFYWYSILWLFLNAVLQIAAYWVLVRRRGGRV